MPVVPGANNGLDQVLLAGREGVSLLWYDIKAEKWTYQNIGTGLPQQPGNPFWGSGSGQYACRVLVRSFPVSHVHVVDVARVHGDSAGYVASCEVSSSCLHLLHSCTEHHAGLSWQPCLGVR